MLYPVYFLLDIFTLRLHNFITVEFIIFLLLKVPKSVGVNTVTYHTDSMVNTVYTILTPGVNTVLYRTDSILLDSEDPALFYARVNMV